MIKCSALQQVRNMWLAGMSYQEVMLTETFKERLNDRSREQVAVAWINMEQDFKLVCSMNVYNAEQVYNPRYTERRKKEKRGR